MSDQNLTNEEENQPEESQSVAEPAAETEAESTTMEASEAAEEEPTAETAMEASEATTETPATEPTEEAAVEATATTEETPEVEGATAVESLLPKNDNPKLKWYVVHTYSGYEQKAKLSLMERAKLLKMEERIGEIIIPQQVTEKVLKSGKKKQTSKTSFPGYIIVQLDLDDDTIGMVKATPRITGFIGNQKKPRALPDNEVLRLTNPEAAKAQAKPTTEVRFSKGEGVKVKDGPFSEFDGVIDEVKPDKAKLRVLVSIFGRETPVELDYNQVEKL